MEDYDAFSAGVDAGGLRSRGDIKTLICYLIRSLDRPITRGQLSEIMQKKGLANYFDVSQSLSELISSGNITAELVEGGELLHLSDASIWATDMLEAGIPRAVREKAVDAGVEILTRARNERETQIDVEQLKNGYNVTFTMSDHGDTLMRLSLYASDLPQVETIKSNFLRDPVLIYSGIIASLTT